MTTNKNDWWNSTRKIDVLVDNESWIIPYAKKLVEEINNTGDKAEFIQCQSELNGGDIVFFLGCINIVPKDKLKSYHKSLVVHESDLPKGRGFSPLTWQVIEDINEIPICLIEAGEEVDSGNIIYRDVIKLIGNELLKEIHELQGNITIKLCLQYLSEKLLLNGKAQNGPPSYYSKRNPEDSKLSIDKTLKEQFGLLRVVDNDKYPAFFEHKGKKFILKIYDDK